MKKKLGAVLLLSAVCAVPAFAEDDGFYFGASASSTNSDYPGSKSPLGWAIQGGYGFNKNFALELQYADFGNIAPAGSMKPTGFSFVGVGILPVADKFGVIGKVGMATIGTKISGSGIPGVDGTYRKNAATYGVGAQYAFTPAWALRAGVDRFSTGGTQGGFVLNNGTATVAYVGFKYENQ